MDNKEFLKIKKIKVTKARIEILNILRNAENGLSAEKIYHLLYDMKIEINLSTVYRTLELFEEKEIIEKISLNEGVAVYKLHKHTHNHLLKCEVCQKEIEIPCPMSQIEEMLLNKTGFTLTEHKLVLKGVCRDCKDKQKKK